MKKEDSTQIDVYEYVTFEVKAVEDGTYGRTNCIEIVPKTSQGSKLVLSTQNK